MIFPPPHFKFLLSSDMLDFVKKKKKKDQKD